MRKNISKILILDNIRSTYNVGAIFRTADCAGVEKIYLIGITPAPIDRFGRKRKDIAKAGLGAENRMPWEQVQDIDTCIEQVKQDGYFVIAVEQSPDAASYKEIPMQEKMAFIFGNEVEGIAREVSRQCDGVAEIPQYGSKESLNVSVAAGIILFYYVS